MKAQRMFKLGSCLLLAAILLTGQNLLAASGPYECENNLIEIMFNWDSQVRLRGGVPVDLRTDALAGVDNLLGKAGTAQWQRICNLPEERLDELQAVGETRSGKPLYNLNNIYRLRVGEGVDIWKLAAQLEALPGVILARPVPKPMPTPNPPSFQSLQNYEDPAASTPTGIDAEYAWTLSGGNGSGVTICDLEYGWNYLHSDLTKLDSVDQLNPDTCFLPSGETDDHGTAVVGVLVSDNNGWGTSGIAYGADIKVCGTYYGHTGSASWNVPGALAYAIAALSAGDVILLENQWDYSDPGTAHPDFIPVEWWLNYHPGDQTYNGVYAAIETAIANGIHVVEAGGNGGAPTAYVGIDTDALNWYGNSGAIIVGAGGAYNGGVRPSAPEGDLQKVDYSSYGSRFDLQGWGEDVMTTGYSDYWNSEGKNLWYTYKFAGTSSASPVVAGAVACCVGRWIGLGYPVAALTPADLRSILINTGTAQVTPPAGHIGPRPNLLAAFAQLSPFVDASTGPLPDAGRGHAVAWGDYDGDGDEDLFITNTAGGQNRLFRNDGGGNFSDVTPAPLAVIATSNGAAWADYDNDGDVDLYVGCWGASDRLYRNDGGGNFTDVTSAPLNESTYTNAVSWVDYDNDGNVDICITCAAPYPSRLYHNDGGGTFSLVYVWPFSDANSTSGVTWGDYDNDGDQDCYLLNYGGSSANHLARNDGGGSFTDVASGPLADINNGQGAEWVDYDNDGDMDLYFTNFAGANKLCRNDGGGVFTDATSGGLGSTGQNTGLAWGDYDNDGDLDLYVVEWGGPNKLFRNDGGGTFTDATAGTLGDSRNGMGTAWADYDGDGDIDLYLVNEYTGQSNVMFRNQVGAGNNWLHIKLVGTVSNRSGIGARVRVVAGSLAQIREISGGMGFYSQNSLTAEFGLGSQTDADTVQVFWPSGLDTTLTAITANQVITIFETSTYVCGDADGNTIVNISDAVFLISYIFGGGSAPDPLLSGDADCNGIVNISDAVYLIAYIFGGGAAPCASCP
jgi:hypothetical protein